MERAWDAATPTGRWLAEVLGAPDADRVLRPSLTFWWLLDEGDVIESARLDAIAEAPAAALSRQPRRLPLIGAEGGVTHEAGGDPLWTPDYALRVSPPRLLHGRTVQAITLSPLRAESGRLLALRGAVLHLETGLSPLPSGVARPERPDFPLRESILAGLQGALLNPEALPAPAGDRAIGGDGFPTEVPSIEGAAVEMVIVTVDSFADLCQAYADQRTGDGVPTVVRTLDWMRERYPFGSDRQEMLRRFIQDAYAKWSTRFVLLVGDAPQIPPRYVYTEVFLGDPREAPTDLYYGCLDGDWNADHDMLWGEAADSSAGSTGDEADFLPEVNVGRFPAATRAQCETMLSKSAVYHGCTAGDYQNKILMLAEVLFPYDYPEPPDTMVIVDGAEYCESIYVRYTGPDQVVTRLYETADSFPGSLPLTVAASLAEMTLGHNLVLHNGHGARQTMRVGDGSIGQSQVAGLWNGDRTFLLYMVNCTAAAFDYFECLAETFLINTHGGAHAVIGSTRETFANTSVLYQDVFFDVIWNDHGHRLGELQTASLNYFEPYTLEDHSYRWAHISFILLGDPSLWLHYKLPVTANTTLPGSKVLDGTPLQFSVIRASNGEPIPDAMVKLRKGDEDYQFKSTDAAGQVSFALKAQSGGSYQVDIDGRDVRPYARTLPVTLPGSAPFLSVSNIAVYDVAGGDVIGNGNGIAERDETVRLTLTVSNIGSASATGTSAVLRCSYPGVALLDSTDSYGTIAIGGNSQGGNPYLASIGEIPDDAIVPFTVAITCTQGAFADDFFLEGAAPLLVLHRSDIDDGAGGNGDGNLDVGETATLSVSVSNQGRGTAEAVAATLRAVPGSGLTIGQGSDALGDLPGLGEDLGPAVFTVTRTGPEPPDAELELADAFGHRDTFALRLERPVGQPTAPIFAYNSDPAVLTVRWDPAPEQDAAAFVVERADQEGGPYLAVSDDWVLHGAYEATGLAPYTVYWFRIVPLSAAGLTGAPSAAAVVTTNPAFHAGWPVSLPSAPSGTPVVGDFDGDHENEIIVGAEILYGFNLDGSEMGDGDDNAATVGPIFASGHNYGCSLTATDLDQTGGLELVAGSWDTGYVYVLSFANDENGQTQASVAPGWPKHVQHPYGIWATPVLGDVDGDGDKEIFVADVGGYLMAWHHDGTEVLDGDNNPGTYGVFASGLYGWTRGSVAMGDIDNDQRMEIFAPTSNGYLRCWYGDRRVPFGWPFQAPTGGSADQAIWSTPAIGDLDADGDIEIAFTAENDSLYVVSHVGRRHPGWPLYWMNENAGLTPSVALADVAGDARLELFACGVRDYHDMLLAWFDEDGNALPGWPLQVPISTQGSPVVADLDGDGDLEVVLGDDFGGIWAWHHDAEPVAGFPLVVGDYVRATPTLTDADGDGLLNLVLPAWDKKLYVWDFPVAYDPADAPWYTFAHDQKRTSNVLTFDWTVGVDDALAAPGAARLDPNWPNPFNPTTQFRFAVPEAGAAAVRLAVYDAQGRCVAVVVNETLQPGTHERRWEARDDAGHPLASGVYLARLQVGDRTASRKLTLLK